MPSVQLAPSNTEHNYGIIKQRAEWLQTGQRFIVCLAASLVRSGSENATGYEDCSTVEQVQMRGVHLEAGLREWFDNGRSKGTWLVVMWSFPRSPSHVPVTTSLAEHLGLVVWSQFRTKRCLLRYSSSSNKQLIAGWVFKVYKEIRYKWTYHICRETPVTTTELTSAGPRVNIQTF